MSNRLTDEDQLDELDERIISLLEVDGRRAAADIARALGVPRATVHRRISALTNAGVITVRAFAHAQKIGLPFHVWLALQVSLEEVEGVAEQLCAYKELRWVGIVSGESNILAEAYFRSSEHLHEFTVRRLAKLPGIKGVVTHHVLRLNKFSFDWTAMRHAHEDYHSTDSPAPRPSEISLSDDELPIILTDLRDLSMNSGDE
jgi:Lrp/AsnC family transcriptional regulator, regulator for asnA, asnC and gidA